jgi:membrane-associated protein
LWAAGVTYAGYILGGVFERAGIEIDTVLLPIIAVIILVSVLPPAIHILKEKKNRDALISASKKQFNALFSRNK